MLAFWEHSTINTFIKVLNNQHIQQVDNEKDLAGVTIDDLMKFHLHISFTTSRAIRTVVSYYQEVICTFHQETFTYFYTTIAHACPLLMINI